MRQEPGAPSRYAELFHRHGDNPILTARDWPYPAHTVFNAGACQVGEETVLLVRVEDRRGHSHLSVARSNDGVSNWRIDAKPSFVPDPANYSEEEWSMEDARVTWVDEDRGQWIKETRLDSCLPSSVGYGRRPRERCNWPCPPAQTFFAPGSRGT